MSSIRARRGLSQFTEEFEAQERQRELERTAPLRKAQQEFQERADEVAIAERELAKAELFKHPSAALANCAQYQPSDETPDQITAKIHNAVSQLKLELSEKGITLEQAGIMLFKKLLDVNPNVDSTRVESWRAMYTLLDSHDAFTDRDRTIRAVAKPTAPTPAEDEVNIDEALAACDMRKPEDRARAKKLVADAEAIGARPLWRQFVAFIRETYGYEMSQADKERVLAYCYESGKGLTVKALNDARIQVLGLRSADEELSKAVEDTDRPLTDYSVRQDFKARSRELRNS